MDTTTPAAETVTRRIDPFLMSVLKSRFEAIVREMTLVVMRASRSAVIKNARDFSCAILTYDHQLVSVEDALPIHVMSMDMATRPLTELFDDIKQGDIFVNNCPYTGGTHHADLIMATMNATPTTGEAAVAHAGLTAPGDGEENITDMTNTTPSSASRVRLTITTAATTVAGTAVLIGTDAGDNPLVESVAIGVAAADTYYTSNNVFKTLTHVALTGRGAPAGLLERADLVTEMKLLRHPFREQGVKAQAGIEF